MPKNIDYMREAIATCVLILETEAVSELEDIGQRISRDQFMAEFAGDLIKVMRTAYGVQLEHLAVARSRCGKCHDRGFVVILGQRAMRLMEDGLENYRMLLEHTPECRLCDCEARRLIEGAAVKLEPLSDRDVIIGGRSRTEVRDAVIQMEGPLWHGS